MCVVFVSNCACDIHVHINACTCTCMCTCTCTYAPNVEGNSVLSAHHMAGILRKFDDMVEVILPQLPTSFETIADPEGKAALIWILGEYGEVTTHLRICFYSLSLSLSLCPSLS